MIEILLGILIGVCFGIITGLIPGIHVNLISTLAVAYAGILAGFIPAGIAIAAIIGMAITHTFLDTIPSIFLGAPDAATALSVLPGHRMLLEGEGMQAIKITVLGSFIGLVFGIIAFPLTTTFLALFNASLSSHIDELLAIACVFIILSSANKPWAIAIFSFSGILGYITLNSNLENPLFPLLTGFFGISTLLFSAKSQTKIPAQKNSWITIKSKDLSFSGIIGSISGFLTGILPGLGASTAAAVGSSIKKDTDTKGFLIMIGAISTVNFFISIAALQAINKARNGAIIAVRSLATINNYYVLIIMCAIAAGLAGLISTRISKKFLLTIQKVKYSKLVYSTVSFLTMMTFVLSGFSGLVIMAVSCVIGIIANRKGVSKNTMMACILIPVIIYFL